MAIADRATAPTVNRPIAPPNKKQTQQESNKNGLSHHLAPFSKSYHRWLANSRRSQIPHTYPARAPQPKFPRPIASSLTKADFQKLISELARSWFVRNKEPLRSEVIGGLVPQERRDETARGQTTRKQHAGTPIAPGTPDLEGQIWNAGLEQQKP